MDKNRKVTFVCGAALALLLAVALGASAAIAGSRVLGSSDESQAVIDDAAAELGVEPSALEEALEKGLKNRVQEAVEAGRLTEEQGAELRSGSSLEIPRSSSAASVGSTATAEDTVTWVI